MGVGGSLSLQAVVAESVVYGISVHVLADGVDQGDGLEGGPVGQVSGGLDGEGFVEGSNGGQTVVKRWSNGGRLARTRRP